MSTINGLLLQYNPNMYEDISESNPQCNLVWNQLISNFLNKLCLIQIYLVSTRSINQELIV